MAFAALALVLAAVGLYGLLTSSVARRRREIGVRVALGATPWNIQKIIFGQALRLAVIGLGLGLVVTLACSRVLEGFLFGVTSSDASTFTATALLLLLVVCVASALPAFSATRAQPADVLRR